jgi:hypothetical protein
MLLIALLVPVVQAVVALLVHDGGLAGGINAAAVAVAGALTAVIVKTDAQLPAISGAFQAVLALIAGFVYPLNPDQQAALLAPIAIIVAFVVRDRVTAPVPQTVSEPHVVN